MLNSAHYFPLWLQRWHAMRTILVTAFGAAVVLDLLHWVGLTFFPSFSPLYSDVYHLLQGLPAGILFAPALFFAWRWGIRTARKYCQLSSRVCNVLTLLLLALLVYEVQFFQSVEPRGWLPHRYLTPSLVIGPFVAIVCALVLISERQQQTLSTRLLLLVSFAWLVMPTSIDLAHSANLEGPFFEGGLSNLPLLHSLLMSCFYWVWGIPIMLHSGSNLEGFNFLGAALTGFLMAAAVLADLWRRKVHPSTALVLIFSSAVLTGFLREWENFLWD